MENPFEFDPNQFRPVDWESYGSGPLEPGFPTAAPTSPSRPERDNSRGWDNSRFGRGGGRGRGRRDEGRGGFGGGRGRGRDSWGSNDGNE